MSARNIRTDSPRFKADFPRLVRETRAALSRLEELAGNVDVFTRDDFLDALWATMRKADESLALAVRFSVVRTRQG